MGLSTIISILKRVAPFAGEKGEAVLLVIAILELIAEGK